jgi:hypothetical protein
MLLIGSRAIRVHFPEFREPRDWDLVGTQAEIDALAQRLRRAGPQRPEKAHFQLGKRLVEVANASVVPYWEKVLLAFEHEREIQHDELGPLRVAPPGYLLLTKHCGLIYRVVHWHKNLEDLYFLRDRVPAMSAPIADLVHDAMADSARMFAANHDRVRHLPQTCHPAATALPNQLLHEELHQRLALGDVPRVTCPDAWQGFASHPVAERKQQMLQLLAEEAMVIAAQAWMQPGSHASGPARNPEQWIRWALRTLCIGELPDGLRYFVVNYYREIRGLIPTDWVHRVQDLLPAGDLSHSCEAWTESARAESCSARPHQQACL